MSSEDSKPTTRRRLLSGVAGLGIGGLAVDTATGDGQQQNRIVFNSPSSVPVEYRLAVTGGLRKTSDTGGLFSRSVATKDPQDVIGSPQGFGGETAHGKTQGGVDAYDYTGNIVGFDATNCADFNVWVNGSKRSACKMNRRYGKDVWNSGGGGGGSGGGGGGGGGQGQTRIVLNSPSSVQVDYEFVVTGGVQKTRQTGGIFNSNAVSKDPQDVIRTHAKGTAVSGATQGGVDAYVFTGNLVGFDATNCADFNVWIDGSERSACTLNRKYNVSGGGPSFRRSLPKSDVTVAPDTTMLFEVASDRPGGISAQWFVDGTKNIGPDMFYGQVDYDRTSVHTHTFDRTGTYRVEADVYVGDGAHRSGTSPIGTASWNVQVKSGGNQPPAVDLVRPSAGILRVKMDVANEREFVVEGVDSDSALDRAIWWISQGDSVTDVSEMSGRRDTARTTHDPEPGLPFGAWVVDEHGAISSHAWWDIKEEQ